MTEQVKRVHSRTKLAVIILTAIAVALIIASFLVPPVYAIEQGVGAKVEHKGTSLTIDKDEE